MCPIAENMNPIYSKSALLKGARHGQTLAAQTLELSFQENGVGAASGTRSEQSHHLSIASP